MHVRVVEAGHHKLAFEIYGLRAFLAASAIEQDVVHFANATYFALADGQGFSPGIRRIIRVNAAVSVVSRARRFLSSARFRVECASKRQDNKRENTGSDASVARPGFHRDFSSASPEIPKIVRSTRFNPASRPVESYHSCNEWAPPPLPPTPIEIASIPKERGIFASVEERSMRD